jgi:hypothetical protein
LQKSTEAVAKKPTTENAMKNELEVLHVLSVGAGVEDKFLRLVRDVERYRWLREQTWNSSLLAVVEDPRNSVKLGCDCPSHARLDERIDLSMLAERVARQ